MRHHVGAILLLALSASMALGGDTKAVVAEARRVTFHVFKNAKWKANIRRYTHSGTGAGIGFRKDGWVLTTAHQVDDAKSLTLICPDGVGRRADRWVYSKHMDLAVVHIPDYEVPVCRFAETEAIAIGDTVFAAGWPFKMPFGLSRGIVSTLHSSLKLDGELTQSLQDYIQFDAQANPGNSGGPLISSTGEVVGLICESLSVLPRSLPGVSFAIPSSHARRMGSRLIEKTDKLGHGGLDLRAGNCDAMPLLERERLNYWDREGAFLFDVKKAARGAGLREEDIVVAVEGIRVAGFVHLRVLLAVRKPGDKLRFDIHRSGKPLSIEVVIGENELDD